MTIDWTIPDWMDKGLCQNTPLSPKQIGKIMFPDTGHGFDVAKRVCQNCPVKEQCAEYAIENRIEYGMWGGMTPAEMRERIKSQTRKGVPTTKACEVSGLTLRQATHLAKKGYLQPLGGGKQGYYLDWPLSEIILGCLFRDMRLSNLLQTEEGRIFLHNLTALVRQAPLDNPWLVVSPPTTAVGVPAAKELPEALALAGPLGFVLNIQEVKEKIAI